MTRQELFEIAGYFANPSRNTRIEIEAKQNTISNYDTVYFALTGTRIPIGSDSVYVLPNNADKWGREMRLYFTRIYGGSVPPIINSLMTVGGRPGYDLWNQRLNSKDIIDELFLIGFRLGHPQNHSAISAGIQSADLADFNRGYLLP